MHSSYLELNVEVGRASVLGQRLDDARLLRIAQLDSRRHSDGHGLGGSVVQLQRGVRDALQHIQTCGLGDSACARIRARMTSARVRVHKRGYSARVRAVENSYSADMT